MGKSLYRTNDATLCVVLDEHTKEITGASHVPPGVLGGADKGWPIIHLAVTGTSSVDVQRLRRKKTVAWVLPATVTGIFLKLCAVSASDDEVLKRLSAVFSESPIKARQSIGAGVNDVLAWAQSRD